MNRPTDIPEDVWDDAGDLIDDWAIEFSLAVVISGNIGHVLHQRIARALMTYGQRRADEARESAATVCEDVAQMASDNAANANEPTLTVAFQQVAIIIGAIATAIRSQK